MVRLRAHKVVKLINPSGSGYPSRLTVYNNRLYFSATDGVNGFELWSTDGTTLGTTMVKDINAGAADGSPDYLCVHNNFLYFMAKSASNGTELYVTDGTSLNTQLVKDIEAGASSSSPQNLVSYNGKLYFSAFKSTLGYELWTTDGTTLGTQLVKDINTGAANSLPQSFTVYNGLLYYVANDGSNGYQIRSYNSLTNAESIVVPPIFANNACADAGNYSAPVVALGSMFYPAAYQVHNVELYKLTTTPTAVNEVSAALNFSVYPNPVTQNLHIGMAETVDNASLQIYNLQGEVVHQSSLTYEADISLAHLASGMYLVKVTTANLFAYQKIVKE
jgi:ELWxxDGT repeat protein